MNTEFWKLRYEYVLRWWHHVKRRWELISIGFLVLIAISVFIVWTVPPWMVRHEYWVWAKHPDDYAKLVDDYRKTLVQMIGGAFLLYTLYLTQRRTKVAEETLLTMQKSLEVTQKSLEVTQETQITDRFTKAVAQLGATDSQGKKQMETRLGAIYSLERIAKDSAVDHWTIMEILTAYVRHNAPWRAPDQYADLDTDAQGVMTVIGRRMYERDQMISSLNLTDVDFKRCAVSQGSSGKSYSSAISHGESHSSWGSSGRSVASLRPSRSRRSS